MKLKIMKIIENKNFNIHWKENFTKLIRSSNAPKKPATEMSVKMKS